MLQFAFCERRDREREREREKEMISVRFLFFSHCSISATDELKNLLNLKKKILFTKSIVISCSCFYNIIRKKSDERDEIRIRKGNELLLVEEEKYRNRIYELQLL